jgi:hypothetical protein
MEKEDNEKESKKPDSSKKQESAADKVRAELHAKVSEKTEANKPQHAEIDRYHKLIDEAPVVAPHENPPPGYPRIEVPL